MQHAGGVYMSRGMPSGEGDSPGHFEEEHSFEQDYLLDVFADNTYGLQYDDGAVSSGSSKPARPSRPPRPPKPPTASHARAKKPKRPEVSVTSSSSLEEEEDDEEEEEEEDDEDEDGLPSSKRARPPVKRKKGQDEHGDGIVSEDPGGHSRNSVVAAKERRRERNKVLARKTRVKKKAELELLRDQVSLLQAENGRLRGIVKDRLTTSVSTTSAAAQILCEGEIQLPDQIAAAVQNMVQKAETSHPHLFETLKSAQRSFCISNSLARDQPIVHASPGFVELTGYPIAEILGRNCRFLQGPQTDRHQVALMKKGIENGEEVQMTLLNYKKDGSPFWCHIQCAPMVDHTGKTAFIIGVQCKVPPPAPVVSGTNSGSNSSAADSDDGLNSNDDYADFDQVCAEGNQLS